MTGAVTAVQVGSSPRCRSCRAPIWFGLTAKGRRMPLDPSPTDDGNVVIERVDAVIGTDADVALPRVRVLRKDDVVGRDTPRYVSHFASCPAAAGHRRPKKARASATPADRAAPSAGERRSAGIGDAQDLPLGEVGMVLAPPTSRGGR